MVQDVSTQLTSRDDVIAFDACAICLQSFAQAAVLDACAHAFCLPCLVRWASIETSCPLCKRPFERASVVDRDRADGVQEVMEFAKREQKTARDGDDDDALRRAYLDGIVCERCASGADEDVLVLCDECDRGWHTYCVGLRCVPRGAWACAGCAEPSARARRNAFFEASARARGVFANEVEEDRERRARARRERGEIRQTGGGGERLASGDEARARQISRVRELREAWTLLQSGQMEFPGWKREDIVSDDVSRAVESASRGTREEKVAKSSGVDDAWDALEKAKISQSREGTSTKRRGGKDVAEANAAIRSPAASPALKRPGSRASSSCWSMSAAAWAPKSSVPSSSALSSSFDASPVAPPPAKRERRELSALPEKEIAVIALGIIKGILKPKYASGEITRDVFASTAKTATRMSVDASTVDPEEIARIVHRLLI